MKAVPSISVRNLQRTVRINRAALEDFAGRALRLCVELPARSRRDLDALGGIHVLLVSDRKMAQLHRQFLDISGPTDVITFQHGEIFISAQTAARQAAEFQSTLERELRLYLVHGLLHLAGFDDQTASARREMEAAQNKIVSAVSEERAL
jgi:probable rRNA maturation factor